MLHKENVCPARARSQMEEKIGKYAILQFNLVSNNIEAFQVFYGSTQKRTPNKPERLEDGKGRLHGEALN